MAAGRSLPGWAVGLSIFGTYVSSISFLANPGKSFGDNWNPFVFSLSLPIAALVATRWFVPFYRRRQSVSAYEHLEQRFGVWARLYAAICYMLTQLARMGTILYLVALAIAPLTGWDIRAIIIGTGGLVILYTLLGGIEAVIWTDVVQSVVLTAGMLVAAVVLVFGMPEGPWQLISIAADNNKFSLGSFGGDLSKSTFWVVLIYGLFINLQNFGIDQSYVQRYQTASSDAAAKRSVWIGALLYLPISAILFFIGTALFAFYAAQPDLAENLERIADPNAPGRTIIKADAVFPAFIASQLPVGLKGLLIAAVLAAAMSSVDSSLNCCATLTLTDFFKRFFPKHSGERISMRVLHISTLAWGILGTAAALAMIRVKSALDVWWNLAGIFSGGMLGLFLLGFISRKAKNPAAIIGVVAGVTLILWATVSQLIIWPEALAAIRNPLHANLTIVAGTLTIFLVGIVVSRVWREARRTSD